jgi:hypothetical protein
MHLTIIFGSGSQGNGTCRHPCYQGNGTRYHPLGSHFQGNETLA